MDINIICESIDIDDSSGSKANVGLINSLHSLGHNLTVLHYTRKPIQLNNIKCIQIYERKRFYYLLSRVQRIIQRHLKIKLSDWKWLVIAGLTSSFFPPFLFALAQTQLDSGITSIFNSIVPLMTTLVGIVLFGAMITKRHYAMSVKNQLKRILSQPKKKYQNRH